VSFIRSISVLAVAGCASTGAAGGASQPWRELTTEHFVLATDLDAKEARELARNLETFREALMKVALPSAPPRETGRVPAFVFASGDEFRELAGDEFTGLFFHNLLLQPAIVMMGGSFGDGRARIVKHELVHYLARFYLPKQPQWLSEGLACYFETLTVSLRDNEVTFGEMSPGRLRELGLRGFIPTARLISGAADDADLDRFYGESFLVVHYLREHDPKGLSRYENAMAVVDSPVDAWTRAFPDLGFDRLDKALQAYTFDRGQFKVTTYRFTPPAFDAVERLLSGAEVSSIRATVRLAASQEKRTSIDAGKARERAKAELAEALRADPFEVRARAARLFLLQETDSLADLRELTRRHPSSWMAWTLLAKSLGDGESAERTQAVERALDLAEADASVIAPFTRVVRRWR
jgi:hypothetical protein